MRYTKFAPFILLTLFGLVSCLNPIGFNPEGLKISADVSGSEIGIDNINNAELRFVNHTKSMDIVDVEILIDGETKASSFYSYGDSRIAGGPHAGTSEAILERPTGTNGSGSIKVTGYKVVISYQKAGKSKLSDTELGTLNTQSDKIVFTIGNYTRTEGDNWGVTLAKKLAENLLRGKQIVHFYRDKNGSLQVSAGEPDADDKDTIDFVNSVDITNGTHIDLGNLELGINLGNLELGLNNTNPIKVEFSTEVMSAIGDLHIKLADLTAALNAINGSLGNINSSLGGIGTAINNQTQAQTTSIASLGAIMNQLILSGNGGVSPNYALVIVQNHTSEIVKDIAFTNKRVITNTGMTPTYEGPGDIPAEGQDFVVMRNGSWDFVGKAGTRELASNVIAPQQKYLHIYRSTNGGYKVVTSEKDWLAARPEDALKEYGYLAVRNESNREIESVYFVKKFGSGNAAEYDFDNKGSIQKISPYGTIKSDARIETGNYGVFASLDDGSVLFNGRGRDVAVYAQENANDATRNVLVIRAEDVRTIIPPKITYNAYTNGGPGYGLSDTDDAYETTSLFLSFSATPATAPIINILSSSRSMFGSPVQSSQDPRFWEIPVTANATERVTFSVSNIDIVDTSFQVNVFKKLEPPPANVFNAVTQVYVNNGEDFVIGQAKQIMASVFPEEANYRHITWSIDLGDTQSFDIKKLYGLGSLYNLNMSDSGWFKINTGWQNSYWYVAAIVENGKSEGTRNPQLLSINDTFTDLNGNSVSGSMTVLYDPQLDFVKMFRFNRYIAPEVPRYIDMKFVNGDGGYNPAMTRLIVYRLKDDVNIGSTADVKNGNPVGLNFKIYKTNGGQTETHTKDLNVSMGIRYPTIGDSPSSGIAVTNTNVANLPKYLVNINESNVVSINGDTSQATNTGYVYVHESAVLEFDRPMNRINGTPWFTGNSTALEIRFDGTGNWLMAWIGSNQYQTTDVYRSGGPGLQYPSKTTGNSSKWWYRGGSSAGNANVWFILPPTLKKMKTGDKITVQAKEYGIKYP